jgi:hypothetical protein
MKLALPPTHETGSRIDALMAAGSAPHALRDDRRDGGLHS